MRNAELKRQTTRPRLSAIPHCASRIPHSARRACSIRGCINFFWFFFKWGLALAVVAALVSAPLLYRRVDEEIRQRIEAKIAGHYSQLSVRIRSAQLIDGEGIEVRGLSIVEPGATGPQAELLYIDEMFLACQTSLQELVQGEPKITQIKIRRPMLRSTRRPDGTFSCVKLLPVPRLGGTVLIGSVENGMVEIFDPLKNPTSMFTLRDVHSSFRTPDKPPADGHRLMDVQGSFSAEQTQKVELSGTIDLDAQRWALKGTIDGMEISPELRAALPTAAAQKLAVLGNLRGEARIGFSMRRDADLPAMPAFDVEAELLRGRIDDPRLPYPLSDLHARVRANNNGFTIDELTAASGKTTLKLSCQRNGSTDGSPLSLVASARSMSLDQSLAKVLSPPLLALWHRFLPEGEIDADVKLAYDGKNWQPDIEVRCLNVAFTYQKFPYRLERASGQLTLHDNRLKIDLKAYAGGQPVRIRGDVMNPGTEFTGWVEFDGGNLPFDEKFFAAMSEKVSAVVREFHPQGTFNMHGRVWRDDRRLTPHEHVEMRLNRCSMNYEKFSYPLSNIRGIIEHTNRNWSFRKLEGTNDTGLVHCEGTLVPVAGGNQLNLTISADNLPLEEELRDALSPNMQQLWTSLRPRGSCDVQAEISYLSAAKRLGLRVDARLRPETTSIEPVAFPYRLEKLRGDIHYQDGHVDLKGLEAVHGRTYVSSGGQCDFLPDGGWNLQLKKLTVDRLRADHELTAALPDGLRKAAAELKPSAPMNLRGSLTLARGGGVNARMTSEWDLSADLNQTDVEAGVKLQNIYGSVQLAGAYDGQRYHCRGDVALDSVTYKNFQFTQVLGPIWIDNSRLLLGAWAESKDARTPRRMTAKLYNGTLLGDCQVIFGATPQFQIRANLSGADLGQFAKENLTGPQHLQGKISASLQLQGNSKGPRTFLGEGNARLYDADVYELPAMVQLLKILSVRTPDKTAFTHSDIDFRVQGEHVLFDRINFNGDAISLLGRGQMNLDTQVNLTFRAVVGRGDWQLPVLRNMLANTSEQIMQIHVEGTMDHPMIRREAFPGVNQALQQLQADLQNPGPPPAPAPQARRLVPPPGQN